MTDLEHDLREMFEQRASHVDAPGLPPKDVLRRGRRRQAGTVVTGLVACLIGLGVAAAAVGQARHPALIPGRGNDLPERTTSIGGVPVTAPAGWTLVDDWPLAAVLATTNETCSFSGPAPLSISPPTSRLCRARPPRTRTHRVTAAQRQDSHAPARTFDIPQVYLSCRSPTS